MRAHACGCVCTGGREGPTHPPTHAGTSTRGYIEGHLATNFTRWLSSPGAGDVPYALKYDLEIEPCERLVVWGLSVRARACVRACVRVRVCVCACLPACPCASPAPPLAHPTSPTRPPAQPPVATAAVDVLMSRNLVPFYDERFNAYRHDKVSNSRVAARAPQQPGARTPLTRTPPPPHPTPPATRVRAALAHRAPAWPGVQVCDPPHRVRGAHTPPHGALAQGRVDGPPVARDAGPVRAGGRGDQGECLGGGGAHCNGRASAADLADTPLLPPASPPSLPPGWDVRAGDAVPRILPGGVKAGGGRGGGVRVRGVCARARVCLVCLAY